MTVVEDINKSKDAIKKLDSEDKIKSYIADYINNLKGCDIASKYGFDLDSINLIYRMACKQLDLSGMDIHIKKDISDIYPSKMDINLANEVAEYYMRFRLRKTTIKYNISNNKVYEILKRAHCKYRRSNRKKSSNG